MLHPCDCLDFTQAAQPACGLNFISLQLADCRGIRIGILALQGFGEIVAHIPADSGYLGLCAIGSHYGILYSDRRVLAIYIYIIYMHMHTLHIYIYTHLVAQEACI